MALLYKKYLTSAIESSDDDSNDEEFSIPGDEPEISFPAENQGPPIQPGLPLNPMDPFYLTTCFVKSKLLSPLRYPLKRYNLMNGRACRNILDDRDCR